MRVLIKLGGTLLDSAESQARLAREIAGMAKSAETVVVHGGGKQMTRFLAERGVESRFVNGLRVTTPEVLDAVLKVLAGTVNHSLVAAFTAAGGRPVGLSGLDASLCVAEQLCPELGAVGRPVKSNGALLELLTAGGYIPVVACIGGGENGEIYNVNADQMAVSCAAGFHADRLYFLTDVDGVKDEQGAILPTLTPADIDRLVASGVATGGMQAKLEAAKTALSGGVGEIVIAPGQETDILLRLSQSDAIGTRVVRGGGQ